MTALSDLLRDSGTDPARAVERIAGSDKYSMDKSAVYRYLEGKHPEKPRERYLQALAHGFQLKITDVRTAARVSPGELGPWIPPDESGQLSKPVRAALDELIRTIVKVGIEPAGTGSGKTTEKTDDVGERRRTPQPAPTNPLKRAARKGKSTGRARQQQETDEMTAPDPEGPEFGA